MTTRWTGGVEPQPQPAGAERLEQLRAEARGWFNVRRLAERERRRDAGEPLLRIERDDQDAA